MKITVINSDIKKEDIFIQAKEIICPQCNESCRIKIENGKIKLFGCINNHNYVEIDILNFKNTQKINISKIICNDCKDTNMGNVHNYEFYKCLTCRNNVCLICQTYKHNKSHILIKYEQKNYICPKHNYVFFQYCKKCKINMCLFCNEEHSGHEIISFINLLPKSVEINNKICEIEKETEIFKNNIKDNKYKEIIEFFDAYKKINIDILTNFNINASNLNYNILENLKEIINNNDILKKIIAINNNNLKDKINDIIDLYNEIKNNNASTLKMSINNVEKKIINIKNYNNINININKIENKFDNKIDNRLANKIENRIDNKPILNELNLEYEGYKEGFFNLFGYNFVKYNKDKCYLLIDGKKIELCESYYSESIFLDVKLIETKTITDMSFMFKCCESLVSLSDIFKWNTSNVTNMHDMFSTCKSLKSLPDISKWNTANVIDMSYMFWKCDKLKSLPDISKWDTSNVKTMKEMFFKCFSLLSLPDISKWNTCNVTNMDGMFCNCLSLLSLPDISKWNTSNVINMLGMFLNCNSLKSIPDISKWNTSNVKYMNSMFKNCKSLKSIPDISKWNNESYTDSMFENCSSLISLPDISEWILDHSLSKKDMFKGVNEKVIKKIINKINNKPNLNEISIIYDKKKRY